MPADDADQKIQTELSLFDGEVPAEKNPAIPDQAESSKGEPSPQYSGWESSILESSIRFLTDCHKNEPTINLSDWLVVVPTRNAGRRLRESLAVTAAQHDSAVFPPLVVTQDFFSAPERIPAEQIPDGHTVANRETTRLLWAALLLEINLDRFRCVFPVDPISRDLTWAMKTADELLEVRNLLTDSSFTFAGASTPLGEYDMEPLRWKELADLEALAIRRSQDLNLQDETLSRINASRSGTLPPEIRKILVAGTPDLNRLSINALQRAKNFLPVDIMIHAPESESHRFDEWGRPIPAHWLEAEIEIPDSARFIRDAATPTLQAELACDLLGELENPAAFAAIGVPDPETISPLEQAADRRGWSTYDPAGQPVSSHGIYYLLDQTAALLATRSFEAVSRLLRCPDFAKALTKHLAGATLSEETASESPEQRRPADGRINSTSFLELVDRMRERCLPDQIEDALSAAKRNFSKNPELEAGFRWITDWMLRFRKEPFGTVLIDYLTEIFADRSFTPQETTHGAFSEVASTIFEAEAAFDATREAFGNRLQPSDRFHLLLELIRQRHLYDEREPENIDLQGWLELLWEDAPHLVVTGMNDHAVPEAIIGHAFLPDSARRALGVPNNDDRFARDAYLLTTLIETRRYSEGRIDLLFGRQSESGDPLRPSRLLFQCSDEELPDRTLQFFGGETPSTPPLPWTLPWKLAPQALPEEAKIFQHLSVTQFRNYLTCPFRFYLQHGLRMEEVDPEKSEMDARDFGNLIHDALERFAGDPVASISTDSKKICDSFETEVDAILYQRYGSQLSTPVLIQREAARRRLGWWAEIEAEERAAGWRILEPETSISTKDYPFALADLPISGRIDRIEEHEDGRLRVFDFKTHAIYDAGKFRNKRVSEYHIAPIKRTEDSESFPKWSLVENDEGKPSRWVDLQIPLYLLALAKRFPNREITAGHIALGPTEAEIVLDLWGDLGPELLSSAQSCAEGVIEAVQSRKFWPPAERLPWSDPFEELLFSEAEEAVDATGLK